MSQILTGARIFTGAEFLDQHAAILSNGRIDEVCPANEIADGTERLDLGGGCLAPGFIDLQVNGGGGVLFNNSPTVQTLRTMLDGHRSGGTTALLPTLISDTPAVQRRGLRAVQQAIAEGNDAILGVHLEGPHIDHQRRGAHRDDHIRALGDEDTQWLTENASTCRILLTLAPEHTRPGQISSLVDAGIIVCCGHSAASYRRTVDALEEGLSGFTHLFNAMSPLGSREPGVTGAALADPESWCGIIVDCQHVHPATVSVALRCKPRGKIYLVTDSMATVGSKHKTFELYGETIQEKGGRLLNKDNRLAGSAISMIDAVRMTCQGIEVGLDECLRMASLYPAQFLGISDERGRIAPDRRADLVHFNDRFEVLNTWIAGTRQEHNR